MSDHVLLWFDLETTGLDEHTDYILEVGWGVTGLDLDWIIEPSSILVHRPTLDVNSERARVAGYHVDEFVFEMHQESGLWDDLRRENIRGAVSEFAAERTICAALDRLEPGLVSMAGSGVSQFDMRWTAKWMPALHRRLTYYSIDMGTFERTLSVLTSGQMPSKRQGIAHRAVPDIMFSHSLAKSYRATLR